MPRRSKKSRAKSLFYAQKHTNMTNEQSSPDGITNIVCGTFHQGNSSFSDFSRGIQCPAMVVSFLCTINRVYDSLNSSNIDDILIHGDALYTNTARSLEAFGELSADRYLLHDQLPSDVVLGTYSYSVQYEVPRFGRLDENLHNPNTQLMNELQECFNITNWVMFKLDDYMMGIYKNPNTSSFVFFDSHSRDESGFPTSDGTAIALYFVDLQHLHRYLCSLADRLHVHHDTFYIIPITINDDNTHKENNPGCTSNAQHTDQDETSCQTSCHMEVDNDNHYTKSCTSRLSRYQKYMQELSEEKRQDILAKKRKRSKENYASKVKGQHKRLQAKLSYQNPEIAEEKKRKARETSREAYQNPEVAEKKKQKAREAYQNPEIAEEKKRKSRETSHEAYQNPEVAEEKKQKAREAYQNPEIAEEKKQKAREAYQNPEIAEEKKRKSRETSHEAYQNPEKAAEKKQKVKEAYNNAEKGRHKRTQAREKSKELYDDPEMRHLKIQQSQSNRSKKKSADIDIVVARFKKDCNGSLQLIYVCKICQRINFRHQVKILRRENYNQRILLKSLPPGFTIENLNPVNDKDDEKAYICNTCHSNLKSKRVPRLATVNGLEINEQPAVLSHLNMLERHLISPAIPFMKMINLIKGSQKGIHGQVVVVKSDIISVAETLPRLPTDQSLIRVKLKRKLEYKGHHMCQDINPANVRTALVWLKENNREYADIDIDFEHFDNMLDDQLVHGECRELHVDDNDIAGEMSNEDDPTQSENVISSQKEEDIVESPDDNSNNRNNKPKDGPIDACNDKEHDVTNTSAPLYSFLHAVDFAQYLADKNDTSILTVAPGEGNDPELVLEMESKCFPVEFPKGSGTYNEKREQKLSPSRYFNSRLFSADNRFSRNPEYIFFALYCTEVHQIHSNVSIATRIGSTKTSDGKEITAAMLRDHEQVKQLIKRDEGYRFLTQIRGTPAYWERSKKDLFAMIRQLGIPTFFLTFSAADRRWIEIDNAILKTLGKPPMTPEQHKNMTWDQHCDIIMSHPVAAAKMFEARVHEFINNVILSPARPIGQVEDYYYRTEFQQRGWPHIHMVAWVKDAPKLNENPEHEVTEFVDKYISCEVPPESDVELHEIVTSVQVHSKNHTKSCRKTGKKCRFNFPKPPSNRTFICHSSGPAENHEDTEVNRAAEQEILNKEAKAKKLLDKIWELLQSDYDFINFEQLLIVAGITQFEFQGALETISQRDTVYLKRRIEDQWINNYNPHLIRCWNGNMDIQYVLDPYACVMYIVSYVTKSEREMGDLLRNAQREAGEGNNDAVDQLRKLGSIYLQNREVSVMGAIYQICSMPLRNSTRKVIFLQTALDGQRISLPLKALQENAGNSEQVWMTTQIEKYLDRPDTPKYNSMCMATFYARHHQVSAKSDNMNAGSDEDMEDDTDDEASPRLNKPIKLQNYPIKMKERRGKSAVIRYPRVSKKKDSERYHMNMLRLYLPHRNKNIKPDDFPTYESYHMTGFTTINDERLRVKDVVDQNMTEFEPKTAELDEAWETLQQAPDIQDAWAAIVPQAEQQRLDDQIDHVRIDDSDDDFQEIEVPELSSRNRPDKHQPRCAIETCKPEITEEEAESMMRKLNDKQRQLFNHVAKWCDNKVMDHTLPPFRIFLTGGAGTGKSHVIRCIKYYAQKRFARMSESADDITVLLIAHTGTAAYNIAGETICSAFRIGSRISKDYKPLAEESINTLRTRYQHLQLVVIDEVSMVSANQLTYIHGRLQQIKGTSSTSYFGNVSILAVGDFFQLPPISPPTPLCFPHRETLKDLWNPLFQKVELTEIMRQRDDAIFAQMLNRLRVRTENEPLEDQDKELLRSRIVHEVGENILKAPSDALHLFYLNKDVDAHNETKLASLNSNIVTIKAEDVDQKGGRIIKVHETPHDTSRKDDTSLVPSLKLAVGARTMLIANVDVSDGLCNGVSGVIRGIQFTNSKNMPHAVYVQFDSERIGTKARSSQFIPPEFASCVPIVPRKDTFQIKGKSYTTTREQIPLKLAWAVTIHKVQGQTVERAVIDMKGLKQAMAYVALSRVTSLQGMYLLNCDFSRIYCNPDIDCNVAQMQTLDLSMANPLLDKDPNKYIIIAHHNIQSLRRHFDDLKSNSEIRKAHVICLSETWLSDNSDLDALAMEGYTLESIGSARGRGVAIYVQNAINYNVVPIPSNACDALAIRTFGNTNLLVTVIYKPVATNTSALCNEINNITAQTDLLDADYRVLVGDFNHNLLTKGNDLEPLSQYHQVITDATTTNGTLLDHIYVKPCPPIYYASVLNTYYSYHSPVYIAIKYN